MPRRGVQRCLARPGARAQAAQAHARRNPFAQGVQRSDAMTRSTPGPPPACSCAAYEPFSHGSRPGNEWRPLLSSCRGVSFRTRKKEHATGLGDFPARASKPVIERGKGTPETPPIAELHRGRQTTAREARAPK
jgi:hypothetical protein